MLKPLKVGDVHYASKAAAIREAQRILHASDPGTEIVGSDATFVRDLLFARGEKLEEIGERNVVRFVRTWASRDDGPSWTACFAAELENGVLIEFSFVTAIDILADHEDRKALKRA